MSFRLRVLALLMLVAMAATAATEIGRAHV